MMIKISCPDCSIDGSISLLESDYEGPYMCWKCRSLYKIHLKEYKLISCDPLSQEEFDRLREINKLQNKFKKDED
jgi:hypothetical protein